MNTKVADLFRFGGHYNKHRDLMDYNIIEIDTRSQKHERLNHKYKINFDSSRRNKWSPEDYVAYENSFLQARNTVG